MRAVQYRIRSQVGALWVSTVVITMSAAVVCAVVIAFAAGAHRTTTLPDRYADSVGGAFDAVVTQEQDGPPRTADLLSLPAVETAGSYTFVFGGLVAPGASEPVNATVFTGDPASAGMRVVSGRAPDPQVESEFVASRSFVESFGVDLGDELHLITISQEQANAGDYGDLGAFGPELTATLVGVVDGPPLIEDPSPLTMFSIALNRRIDDGMGVALSMTAVRLADGFTTDDLRTQLDTLPDNTTLNVESGDYISTEMRRAISTQGRGTWLLAIVAGITVVAVLGQLITRQVRLSPSERQQLASLGYTDGQALTESATRATVPIVVGCLGGGVLAITVSGAFPTGFVRALEPHPGVLVMWGALLGTVAVVALALQLWVVASLVLARWSTLDESRSTALEPLLGHVASPTGGVGVRFAFTRARGERGGARAALAGVVVTVAGLIAALTFGFSTTRLIDQPFRYGVNHDVALGDNGGDQLDDELVQALATDPNVTTLTYYAQTFTRAGDTSVPLLGMDHIRGEGEPTVITGRLPTGTDEVALGRIAAGDTGAGVGDQLTLTGPTGSATYLVVGLVALPGFGSNEGVGEGAVTTLDGFRLVDDSTQVTNAAVRFTSASDAADRYLAMLPGQTDDPFVPASIENLDRVRSIPFALAAVLAALTILTIAHGLLTSVRARRRDLAVLRSLGADSGFVSRTVHWQASAFALVPLLIGVPVGFTVGRLVFAAYARDIGAVDGAVLPLVVVAAIALGVMVLANLMAVLPARGARRLAPATVLRRD